MDFKYLSDAKGNITGVFVPIEEWQRLQKEYGLPAESTASPNPQLQQGLAEAMKQAADKFREDPE